MFNNKIDQAKVYFKQNVSFGIDSLAQAAYRQLDADLYHDCETFNRHPLVMRRPY